MRGGGETVKIDVKHKKTKAIRRAVQSEKKVTIAPHSRREIPIRIKGIAQVPAEYDYTFAPEQLPLGKEGGIAAALMDCNTSFVVVSNDTDEAFTFQRKQKLGMLVEYTPDGVFHVGGEKADGLRPMANVTSWKKKVMAGSMLAMGVFNAYETAIAGGNEVIVAGYNSCTADKVSPTLETVLPNGVTVFGEKHISGQLEKVIQKYQNIWEPSQTTVDIPEDEHMTIDLKPNVSIPAAKVYPLSGRDRDLVDDTFGELHNQEKMEFTKKPTKHGYPVFVVWKESAHLRKGRVVIDTRGLNKLAEDDCYPMPRQEDITAAVAGCPYISVVDAASYFYQWPVKKDDQHKLTVVSHRGQETFKVAVMGYKGSPAYVQRQTDNLLRDYRHFVRVYIDDFVIFSKTLEEHLEHLEKLFSRCAEKRLHLGPKKSFIGYPVGSAAGTKGGRNGIDDG